jgi:hypothetical protein
MQVAGNRKRRSLHTSLAKSLQIGPGCERRTTKRDHKNSPSRLRFRPPCRLTFGFRLRPPGWASTYSRSVLGARGNLDAVQQQCKRYFEGNVALCIRLLHQAEKAPEVANSALQRKVHKKFAEPVALSSGVPADFPLPRTATRNAFGLVTLRARRSRQSSVPFRQVQERRRQEVLANCDPPPVDNCQGGCLRPRLHFPGCLPR